MGHQRKRVLAVVLAVLVMFVLGAGHRPISMRITIGGGVSPGDRFVFEKKIPIVLPVSIEYDEPFGGCGGVSRQKVALELHGVLSLFYDSNTGENFVRMENIHYTVVLTGRQADIRKEEK